MDNLIRSNGSRPGGRSVLEEHRAANMRPAKLMAYLSSDLGGHDRARQPVVWAQSSFRAIEAQARQSP
jgi:hypothetical protein